MCSSSRAEEARRRPPDLRAVVLDGFAAEPLRELDSLGWSESHAAELRTLIRPRQQSRFPDRGASEGDGREESVISRADRARDAGRWELAARLYRQALDEEPDNPPIWVQ